MLLAASALSLLALLPAGTELYEWDRQTGQVRTLVSEVAAGDQPPLPVAYSPSGDRLVMRIERAETGSPQTYELQLWHRKPAEGQPAVVDLGKGLYAAWSADGNRLLIDRDMMDRLGNTFNPFRSELNEGDSLVWVEADAPSEETTFRSGLMMPTLLDRDEVLLGLEPVLMGLNIQWSLKAVSRVEHEQGTAHPILLDTGGPIANLNPVGPVRSPNPRLGHPVCTLSVEVTGPRPDRSRLRLFDLYQRTLDETRSTFRLAPSPQTIFALQTDEDDDGLSSVMFLPPVTAAGGERSDAADTGSLLFVRKSNGVSSFVKVDLARPDRGWVLLRAPAGVTFEGTSISDDGRYVAFAVDPFDKATGTFRDAGSFVLEEPEPIDLTAWRPLVDGPE